MADAALRHYRPPLPAAAAEAKTHAKVETEFDAAATLGGRTPVQGETLSADGKAAGVLTLLGLMFTILARFGPELGACLHIENLVVRGISSVLLMGFASMALCAVVQVFRTISPRFPTVKPSLAFFGEIARLRREEYFQRVESMSMRDAVDQILSYNHTAATICARKFRQLRFALRFFEVAAGCWLLLWSMLLMRSLAA